MRVITNNSNDIAHLVNTNIQNSPQRRNMMKTPTKYMTRLPQQIELKVQDKNRYRNKTPMDLTHRLLTPSYNYKQQ